MEFRNSIQLLFSLFQPDTFQLYARLKYSEKICPSHKSLDVTQNSTGPLSVHIIQ